MEVIKDTYIDMDLYIGTLTNNWNKLQKLRKLSIIEINMFEEPYKMYLYGYYGYYKKLKHYNNKDLGVYINEHYDNILLMVITNGHIEIVKYLVEKRGFDSKCFITLISNPLRHATIYGNLEIMKYLISQNFDLFRVDIFGNTNLMTAIEYGYIDIVKYLIEEAYFYINYMTNSGYNPFFYSVKYNQFEIMKYLISIGCNINIKTYKTKYNVLFYIMEELYYNKDRKHVINKYKKTFKYLYNLDEMNTNIKCYGRTLYDQALFYKVNYMTKYLKKFKSQKAIKYNINNKTKYTVLFI